MTDETKLEDVGRARRKREGESGVELWQVDEPRVMARLATLGKAGVGGFSEAGEWIARRAVSATLDDLPGGARLAWRKAMGIARDVGRALHACERAGLFPGPLRPDQIVLPSEGAAWFLAEPLVRAIVGASDGARRGSVDAKWTPPEQASGDPWDSAANRYALGLVLYRLLAGKLPFGGAGVRHAFEEQRAGAPPFEDAIARELEPGVQAFVLRMLAAAKAERPGDAGEIVRACEALLGEGGALEKATPEKSSQRVSRGPRPAPGLPPNTEQRTGMGTGNRRGPIPHSHSRSLFLMGGRPAGAPRGIKVTPWLPLALGAAVALFALLARAYREPPHATTTVRPAIPLRTARAADCAPCHAREVAEWERSVMAHAVKSPLFGALESVVEEEVGRENDCPGGAGILRSPGADVCRDRRTGVAVTGSGGERWCVNCHSPGDNVDHSLPPWGKLGRAANGPVRDLLSPLAMEGISCAACHETVGPVAIHGARGAQVSTTPGQSPGRAVGYEGNATWLSAATGQLFLSRPEDLQGRPGIANSGYRLDPDAFFASAISSNARVHRQPSKAAATYLASSEFCGACHDVRLFGSDVVGAQERGEHFKRLRNAYSEWRAWSDEEGRRGRKAPGCQGCHMSLYPGVCVAGSRGESAGGAADEAGGCPGGTHFEARGPSARDSNLPRGLVAPSSDAPVSVASHYFTSVDIPLTESLPDALIDDTTLDPDGEPVGLRARRDMLLKHTFRFAIGGVRRSGDALEIPIEIENTGAGHRVPAGFSQERETWVEMTVRDGRGRVVYEVGKVDAERDDGTSAAPPQRGPHLAETGDLRDKVFLRITTSDTVRDFFGRPLGLFGADVIDGPDVPRWSPNPSLGGTRFRGRGLINLQNGFLRCVRCIGQIDDAGVCKPGPGQGTTRADRFEDASYDPDTGQCSSNLRGGNELFETYFPVGALDAERGLAKAPDAIIDTRSAPPGVPLSYTYDLDVGGRTGPFTVEARLRFRSFPPYLVRAFAAYEAEKAREGARPSGPQVVPRMLRRIEVVDLATAKATVP